MTLQDGSITTISYSGNQQTVKDPAGVQRTMIYDALGNLTAVTDATGTTNYTYDALGDLTSVQQSGQIRTFTYDSLSRLVSAANPESGTVSYAYDGAGNVTSRKDARGITTTYTYDALNRLTGKSYSDGTPAVTYSYDGGVNAIGHLTSVRNGSSTSNFTRFDAVGNVLASNQITAGQTYGFAYTYNLAGALTSEAYPSGRVVNTTYDGANRPSALSGSLNGQQKNYATSIQYAPQGAPSSYNYGNTLAHTNNFNSRLQLSSYQDAIGNSQNSLLFSVTLNWDTATIHTGTCG